MVLGQVSDQQYSNQKQRLRTPLRPQKKNPQGSQTLAATEDVNQRPSEHINKRNLLSEKENSGVERMETRF